MTAFADLALHGSTSRVLRLVPLPVLVMSLIPAGILLFNLASFRPAYSVLGPCCRRSPFSRCDAAGRLLQDIRSGGVVCLGDDTFSVGASTTKELAIGS